MQPKKPMTISARLSGRAEPWPTLRAAAPTVTEMTCQTCAVKFIWNQPQRIQNTDGTASYSIQEVVVLVVNARADDYDPLFFCNPLCASEWARVNDKRLQRPSSFPARYYECIDQEPDQQLLAVVSDGKAAENQGVQTLGRRSRLV